MASYTGGPGNDSYTSTSPLDVLDGGGGTDTLTADYRNVAGAQPYYPGVTITQAASGGYTTALYGAGQGSIVKFESLAFFGSVGRDQLNLRSASQSVTFDGTQPAGFGDQPDFISIDWSDLGATNVTFNGSDGTVTTAGHIISWTDAASSVTLGAGNDSASLQSFAGITGIISISTGAGSDTISVSAYAALIDAGADADVITVTDVSDRFRVSGGSGDDLVTVTQPLGLNTTGQLIGGDGTDTLDISFVNAPTSPYPQPDGPGQYIVPELGTEVSFREFEIIKYADRTVDLRTNAAPTITTGGAFTVNAPDTFVVRVAAVDPDGDAVGYAIAGGADAGLFTLDASTGVLAFAAAPDAAAPRDAGGNNVYDVTVSAFDPWGHVGTRDVAVTVAAASNRIAVRDATAGEGDGFAHVLIERTGGTGAFTLDYVLADGTARAGSDYLGHGGTVAFAAGQASYDLLIPLADDALPEPTETFSVTLSAPAGGVALDRASASVTITDDDQAISGTAGNDTLVGTGGANFIVGLGGDDTVVAGGGADVAYGNYGNDLLLGQGGDDRLYGGTGDDALLGGDGRDAAYGEDGNDRLYGGADDDALFGQGGLDALYGEDGNDRLEGDAGDDELYGQAGTDTLYGGDGDDRMYGGAADDLLYGQAGTDTLYGEDGSDRMYGGAAGDRLFGGAAVDFLFGEEGDDALSGDAGDDHLYGQAGADTLGGGAGKDFLFGGDGHDRLTGGADGDVFYFPDGASSASSDVVTDFTRGADRVGISAAGFGLAPGALPASAYQVGSAPAGNTATLLFDPATHNLSWYAQGNGGTEVLLATFDGTTTLSASDFVVL